jgi:hypothetical protein
MTGGSVISLTCFGHVVGGPLLPSLRLQAGSVRVSSSLSRQGGVVTVEALANPVAGYAHRFSFTVSRELATRSPLTEKTCSWKRVRSGAPRPR